METMFDWYHCLLSADIGQSQGMLFLIRDKLTSGILDLPEVSGQGKLIWKELLRVDVRCGKDLWAMNGNNLRSRVTGRERAPVRL